LAIVKTFLREGAKVIFTGRNKADLDGVYNSLNAGNAAYMEWDVSDTERCWALMEEAFDIFGTVDVLVNSAGIYKIGGARETFEELSREYFIKMNKVNFIGLRNMCDNFVSLTGDANNHKKIINIISTTALMPPGRMNKYEWAYAISKHAALAYTMALAHTADGNPAVNGICPGPVKTAMSWKPGQSIVEPRSPNARMGLPEEVAELALVLAGGTGDTITGQIFRCDGGFALK
jgi:NAD(P)-dependent dehydrogenase (short-subunit alcohol dehydrogenase family)